MSYEVAKAVKAQLEQAAVDASKAIKAIDGVGTGPMGLTPDSVKFSPEYRAVVAEYDRAHATLRKFNMQFLRKYKREYAAERRARRATRQTA